MAAQGDEERVSYHACAVRRRADYRALCAAWVAHGSWVRAWESMGGSALECTEAWRALNARGPSLTLASGTHFPSSLREIPWPPLALYAQGAAFSDAPAVAIVGTRRASVDGRTIAAEFARGFARAGVAVVSGLAFGIDRAAHEGALEAGGRTIAVLGNGLPDIYPRAHERVAARILAAGGTLTSEYPPGTPSLPHRFIERNRIVSGLSRGVIVIEAPEESGALATARFAFEQNREVFVVPGPARSRLYRGSHRLIQEGAALVTDVGEVLEELGIARSPQKGGSEPFIPPHLDETARAVMLILSREGKPLTADAIASRARLRPEEVHRTLTALLMEGLLVEQGGMFVAR